MKQQNNTKTLLVDSSLAKVPAPIAIGVPGAYVADILATQADSSLDHRLRRPKVGYDDRKPKVALFRHNMSEL